MANVEETENEEEISLTQIHKNKIVQRTNETEKYNKNQKICYVYLCIFMAMNSFFESSMGPLFPPEATRKGMSETTMGLVFSIYGVLICISSLTYGIIIPKLGVKCVFIIGIAMSGLSNIIFGTLQYVWDLQIFTILAFISKAFDGFFMCAALNAKEVFVTLNFPNQISAVRGTLEIFAGVGFGLGPVFSGYLSEVGGFGVPFILMGFTLILISLTGVLFLPKMIYTKDIKKQTEKATILKLLKIPKVILVASVITFLGAYWSSLTSTLEIHLREFEMSPTLLGTFYLIWSGTYSLVSPIWGFMTDKFSCHWKIMQVGLLLNSINAIFIGPSLLAPFVQNSIALNITALFFNGIITSMIFVPSFNAMLEAALEKGYENDDVISSLVTSLWVFAFYLGNILGPILGGTLMDHWSFEVLTTVLFGISIFTFGASFLYTSNKNK